MLGQDLAVQASRAEEISRRPGGSILVQLVRKNTTLETWPGSQGFARRAGTLEEAYGSDAAFIQECFACHSAVKDNDYAFTHPVTLP